MENKKLTLAQKQEMARNLVIDNFAELLASKNAEKVGKSKYAIMVHLDEVDEDMWVTVDFVTKKADYDGVTEAMNFADEQAIKEAEKKAKAEAKAQKVAKSKSKKDNA